MSDGQIENFHIESGAQGVLAVINNFYGKWEKAFDAKYTKEETFHRGNSKTVMMMNDTDSDRRLTIAQHPDYSMLRIPYRDGYNMYVILPKKWKSLNSVISKLNENDIEACNSFSDYDEIIVKLPKFEMNYAWNANKVLKEMGVRKIFTKTAELNHINDSLYISNIIQKTKVKVDESGTDASAATGVVLKLKEIKEKKVTNFYADHPFAYIIADPFGNYCFMGTFWGYKK
jgi:serpin B